MPIALAIHGGAWNIPDAMVDEAERGVREALVETWERLEAGGTALDAVEHAVCVLEDNPSFDAGRGARLNRAGRVELDASIMEGRDLRAGAVGAVQGILHPVTLARWVMERSEHVMLVGRGAKEFARQQGMKTCLTRSLLVGRELERYMRVVQGDHSLVESEFTDTAQPMGTVGAVAIDRDGALAAATSTGGIQHKLPGRVGDTPIIGSGTYADNRMGAASCTGQGEAIMRVVLAKAAVDLLGGGADPSGACRTAMRRLQRVGGRGGMILIDPQGRVAARYNTPRMARGLATVSGGLRVGVDRRMKKA